MSHNTSLISKLARPLSLAGSGAALATSANAALVQIDFTDNSITAGGGNQLFADIDFNGIDDLIFASSSFFNSGGSFFGSVSINSAGINFASSNAFFDSSPRAIASVTSASEGFVEASFTNLALGGTFQGFLEVNNTVGGVDTGVSILRFIYDDASSTLDLSAIDINTEYTSIGTTSATGTTVIPEPSSLGLLALGAGGLALRRRRKAA